MSLTIETLLSCNGGSECLMEAPFADSDNRCDTGAMQRESAKSQGWVQKGSQDFCPDCAERLGYVRKPQP